MKIVTVLGTRPEIIRLSRVIPLLDNLCEHILVHTGQNYDKSLSDVFFKELRVRLPDCNLGIKSESTMKQIGGILGGCEEVFKDEKPDKLLILGDTNSALSSIVAKRMGIPVFHMEAGNRCYDDRVPEEVNRRIVDHCSDVLMPYTERSRANLLREGIASNKIFVTGNPILEVLNSYSDQIENSQILSKLDIKKREYFLVTLHRAENVDVEHRLVSFVESFRKLYSEYQKPIICSVHPRTRSQLVRKSLSFDTEGIMAIEPVGLFDFIKLEKNAFCVLSDSGTVQEECAIFNIPNVTLRDVTERPETIEVGSNLISGCRSEAVLQGVKSVLSQSFDWDPPWEYETKNVSRTVIKILMSYHEAPKY